MTEDEKGEKLATLYERYQPLVELSTDPRFIAWKDMLGYEKKLSELSTSILGMDRTQEGWQGRVVDNLILYQNLKYAFEGIFETATFYSERAEAQMKKLQENSS